MSLSRLSTMLRMISAQKLTQYLQHGQLKKIDPKCRCIVCTCENKSGLPINQQNHQQHQRQKHLNNNNKQTSNAKNSYLKNSYPVFELPVQVPDSILNGLDKLYWRHKHKTEIHCQQTWCDELPQEARLTGLKHLENEPPINRRCPRESPKTAAPFPNCMGGETRLRSFIRNNGTNLYGE